MKTKICPTCNKPMEPPLKEAGHKNNPWENLWVCHKCGGYASATKFYPRAETPPTCKAAGW